MRVVDSMAALRSAEAGMPAGRAVQNSFRAAGLVQTNEYKSTIRAYATCVLHLCTGHGTARSTHLRRASPRSSPDCVCERTPLRSAQTSQSPLTHIATRLCAVAAPGLIVQKGRQVLPTPGARVSLLHSKFHSHGEGKAREAYIRGNQG
jgi:hypothetical protein